MQNNVVRIKIIGVGGGGSNAVNRMAEKRHSYEGRFTPRVNVKRISKNVYAKTREECEEKLAELIKTMKAEIAAEKKKAKQA